MSGKSIEIKLTPEAAKFFDRELKKKKERAERVRKSWEELEEGVDFEWEDTDIGKDNPNTYPVKKFKALSEKGRNYLKGK